MVAPAKIRVPKPQVLNLDFTDLVQKNLAPLQQKIEGAVRNAEILCD